MTDTTTLEGAIAWMDRALRETREALDEVDVDKRDAVTRSAVHYIVARVSGLPNGASFSIREDSARIDWQGVRAYVGPDPDLSWFDQWLAFARLALPSACPLARG